MVEKNLKRLIYVMIAVCLLTMAATTIVRAQDSSERLLSVEEMRADFETPRRIAREPHPNPYRGISEEGAERNQARTRGQIKKSLIDWEHQLTRYLKTRLDQSNLFSDSMAVSAFALILPKHRL